MLLDFMERKRNSSGQFEKKYPFDQLDVGDSVLIKLAKDNTFRDNYNRIRASAYVYSKRNNVKFQCNQFDTGVRVKRIQ